MINKILKAADIDDVHVDTLLSNMSVAYMQDESEFIAGKVFPVVPVQKQSDYYLKFPKETFFRNRSKKWVTGTNMPQSEFDVDTSPSYSCEYRAFEYPQRWDLRQNADDVIGFDRASVEFVTRIILLGKEIEWAQSFFATEKWGRDYTGVESGADEESYEFVQWDQEASDPIANFKTGRLYVKQNTGFTPNTAVLSESVFEELCENAVIKEKYKYTRPGVLTEDIIAQVLRVKNLYIAGAINITSDDGASSETYDWIFGKHAWLGYVPPRPGLLTPAAGYIFSWKGITSGFETGIERIPDRRVRADYIQGVSCYDMKQVASDLGVFFSGAIG